MLTWLLLVLVVQSGPMKIMELQRFLFRLMNITPNSACCYQIHAYFLHIYQSSIVNFSFFSIWRSLLLSIFQQKFKYHLSWSHQIKTCIIFLLHRKVISVYCWMLNIDDGCWCLKTNAIARTNETSCIDITMNYVCIWL